MSGQFWKSLLAGVILVGGLAAFSQTEDGGSPVITAPPTNLTTIPGMAAAFFITAEGAPPLNYQWSFNGMDLPGATKESLVVPMVSTANEGVYSVRVSNQIGSGQSSGAMLTLYDLAVVGQWDFSQGDLRATVGSDLEYLADTADATSFPVSIINGRPARVMEFGSTSATQGYRLRHDAAPNGGGFFLNQYTVIIDLMYPAQSGSQRQALLQTNPLNHPGNGRRIQYRQQLIPGFSQWSGRLRKDAGDGIARHVASDCVGGGLNSGAGPATNQVHGWRERG